MANYLFISTLIVVGLVVIVLVVYLVGIIIALTRAGSHLQELAGGLQKIEKDTGPLANHLTTINGALDTLHGGLSSVNKHLGAIAGVLKL